MHPCSPPLPVTKWSTFCPFTAKSDARSRAEQRAGAHVKQAQLRITPQNLPKQRHGREDAGAQQRQHGEHVLPNRAVPVVVQVEPPVAVAQPLEFAPPQLRVAPPTLPRRARPCTRSVALLASTGRA
ncbi:hypothetical protein FGB62_358g08 [Gracilaria domingensis]|nr:hypothetical protein FGB62_358g08 [Gracilaria domingensis]